MCLTDLVSPSLSHGLVDFFSNITIGQTPIRPRLSVRESYYMVNTTYTPFLSLSVLPCKRANEAILTTDSTTFTVITINNYIDHILSYIGILGEFREVKLRHERRGFGGEPIVKASLTLFQIIPFTPIRIRKLNSCDLPCPDGEAIALVKKQAATNITGTKSHLKYNLE